LLLPTGGTSDFLEQNHSKLVENSLSLFELHRSETIHEGCLIFLELFALFLELGERGLVG